jgi:hypothetical protein
VFPADYQDSISSLQHKGFCNRVTLRRRTSLLRFAPAASISLALGDVASNGIAAARDSWLRRLFWRSFWRGAVAFDRLIRAGRDARGGKPAGKGAQAGICAPNGTNRKHSDETKAYDESSIIAACYLCNTLPKTAWRIWFRAVPLLRVQKPSVIVMLRRRGASRGRPVIGGSLKSTHATRIC